MNILIYKGIFNMLIQFKLFEYSKGDYDDKQD